MEDQQYTKPTSFTTDFSIGVDAEKLEENMNEFNTQSTNFGNAIDSLRTYLESFKDVINTEDATYLSTTYVNSENGPIKKLEACKTELDKIKTELLPAINQALQNTQNNIKNKIDEAIQ